MTDPDKNCIAYVKLEIKDIILFVRIVLFSEYLLRKLRFITEITSIVQLPYTSPLIPYSRPLGWVGSVRNTSFTYLRILFQHKKQNKIIVFTKIDENQGRSLSPPPLLGCPLGVSSTCSPLIFWDTFPTYLRMLFQQKKKKNAIFGKNYGSVPLTNWEQSATVAKSKEATPWASVMSEPSHSKWWQLKSPTKQKTDLGSTD